MHVSLAGSGGPPTLVSASFHLLLPALMTQLCPLVLQTLTSLADFLLRGREALLKVIDLTGHSLEHRGWYPT